VDASVALKWFFAEDHSASALRVLDSAHDLHAPEFLLVETDNVLCTRIRRGEITPEDADAVRSALRQFPVQWHPQQALLEAAFAVAVAAGITIYDALYVSLAELLRAPCITADRRLVASLANGPLAAAIGWVQDLP
jgi:predicted nucleic acid-binding protein